ncbi:MAG: formimidoylglutamate deiminase [Phenylobacterium sp.]|uniref:formimidoylglutamate deiminase n=1 Tax=Phenylobacterium sp. TaxID=1871053 RepID=UPI00391CDD84
MTSGPTTTLWFGQALLADGWAERVRIGIEGGRIARIEVGCDPAPGEERHAAAVPGLCNLHSHAFQRGMAGLAEVRGPAHDDFWTWREVMYRFLDRLTPDQVEAIAAQAYAEMLQQGFTRVGEFHYLHHDPDGRPYDRVSELAERVVAAADETGLGLTLLPVFYAHGGFGGAEANPRQRRFLNDVESFSRLLEESRKAVAPLSDPVVGVAPHSLRAVTPEELGAVAGMAGGGPVHIHAAEQVKEVEDCLAWSGARPVQWLLEHTAVDEAWCLIHATHLTPEETQGLAARGAVAGLCPVTEANLGDGVFPATDYLRANGRFGVGTDSNILIDAAGELRALEYAQRLTRRGRNILAAAEGASVGGDLFRRALAGGAQALGLAQYGIQAGAAADIVSFDLDHPSMVARARDGLLDAWIFAGGRVDCVWRFGRKVVEAGRHRRAEAIAARYRRVLAELLAA